MQRIIIIIIIIIITVVFFFVIVSFLYQVNVEFGIMYPKKVDRFITRWPMYRQAIIKVGKQEYPAVQDLIKSYEDENGDGKLNGCENMESLLPVSLTTCNLGVSTAYVWFKINNLIKWG